MAKQLTLYQTFRKCSTINRNEWFVSTITIRMKTTCYQLFPCACIPLYKNSQIRFCDTLYLHIDLTCMQALPNQAYTVISFPGSISCFIALYRHMMILSLTKAFTIPDI